MKTLPAIVAVLGLLSHSVFGQGAQADQIKRRARDLSNQNNVRQGVPTPAQPASQRPPSPPRPTTTKPQSAPPSALAKLEAGLAAVKPGSTATAAQKQQLINDILATCRGNRPSIASVSDFVNDLTAALAETTAEPPRYGRLAQNIEGALNSAAMPAQQFDAVIADLQATLQVGGARRILAGAAAGRLKALGLEVRRAASP